MIKMIFDVHNDPTPEESMLMDRTDDVCHSIQHIKYYIEMP